MKNKLRILLTIAALSLMCASNGFAQNAISPANQDNNSPIKMANAAYAKGDYQAAIDILNSVIKKNSRDSEAYYLRGNSYFVLNLLDKAVGDYTKTIALDPNYYKAYYVRASIYYSQHKYAESINDYSKALEKGADAYKYDDSLYVTRAESYAFMDNWQAAYNDFSQAIAIKPDYLHYLQRALVSKHLGNYGAEIDDYQNMFNLAPNEQISKDYLTQAVNNLNPTDFGNLYNSRNEILSVEKQKILNDLIKKFETLTAAGDNRAKICQSINELSNFDIEFEAALHRTEFIRWRNDVKNMDEIMENINRKTKNLEKRKAQTKQFRIDYKCQN